MSGPQIALYARVSSSQQADAGTIASQLTVLRERIAADGGAMLPHLEFIDDSYSSPIQVVEFLNILPRINKIKFPNFGTGSVQLLH
jgi:hypothetical protein